MEAMGFNSVTGYLDFLQSPNGRTEDQLFCNALTTNLTSFFRESHQLDHLESMVKELSKSGCQRLRLWSAGCSTGQEPYSLALVLRHSGVTKQIQDTKILATDIDTSVLDNAKSGVYRLPFLEQIPDIYREGAVKKTDNSFEFNSAVRDLIHFRQLNLLDQWPMNGKFEFIFCRNVVIYFSAETKNEMISRFAEMLQPGGVLYLGHSETILGEHPLLENAGASIYRKVA